MWNWSYVPQCIWVADIGNEVNEFELHFWASPVVLWIAFTNVRKQASSQKIERKDKNRMILYLLWKFSFHTVTVLKSTVYLFAYLLNLF